MSEGRNDISASRFHPEIAQNDRMITNARKLKRTRAWLRSALAVGPQSLTNNLKITTTIPWNNGRDSVAGAPVEVQIQSEETGRCRRTGELDHMHAGGET